MQNKSVKIKGVGDGFKIILDPEIEPGNMLKELSLSLEPISHLMKDAHIYVDSGGKNDLEIANEILPFLKDRFHIKTATPFNNKEAIKSQQQERYRTREVERGWKGARSDVLMISGRVRSGQKIDTEKHLVIYGDVNPGAEVIAGGDVIILGTLSGTAIAGQRQDDKSIIFALDFRPTQIQINDIVGVGGSSKSKKQPELALLNENRELVIRNYMDKNPFSRLPWPEIR